MKRFFLAAFTLFCLCPVFRLTGDPGDGKRYFIAMHPLQFAIRGQRIDFEARVKDTRHWISIGPQVYSGSISLNNDGDEIHKLSGFGIEAAHKIFLDEDPNFFTTYMSYGTAFHSFKIGYMTPSWITVVEDGITYYKYADVQEKEKIKRLSGFVSAGIQIPITKYFFMDAYGGVGLRNSWVKATTEIYPYYTGFMNYAFTGVHPVGGVKIGVRF